MQNVYKLHAGCLAAKHKFSVRDFRLSVSHSTMECVVIENDDVINSDVSINYRIHFRAKNIKHMRIIDTSTCGGYVRMSYLSHRPQISFTALLIQV